MEEVIMMWFYMVYGILFIFLKDKKWFVVWIFNLVFMLVCGSIGSSFEIFKLLFCEEVFENK